MKNIFKVTKSDAFILLTVLILTVFVDLLQAVGIGMVIASVIFMRKASDMVEKNAVLEKVDKYDQEIQGLLLCPHPAIKYLAMDHFLIFQVCQNLKNSVVTVAKS